MLITNINEQDSLFTRLDNLIGESTEMRVLVGFFYISAIRIWRKKWPPPWKNSGTAAPRMKLIVIPESCVNAGLNAAP